MDYTLRMENVLEYVFLNHMVVYLYPLFLAQKSVHCHGIFHVQLFLQFLIFHEVVDNLQKEGFDMNY